jgi:hypothetical protein
MAALAKYVVTANVTIPAGTVTAGSAAQTYGTDSAAPGAGTWSIWPTTWQKGMILWLDSAGLLFAAIGGGNLRLAVDGQDNVGHAALGN